MEGEKEKRMGWKSTHRTVMQAAKYKTPIRKMTGFVSRGIEYLQRLDLQILTIGDSPKEALSPCNEPRADIEFITIFYYLTLKYEQRTNH